MNKNRTTLLTTILLLIVFLAITTGCAIPWVKISDVPIKPATQYKFCLEQEGLVIAVDPFFDEERLKTFFGTDLLKHGILPILVVAENHNPRSGYLLERKGSSIATKVEHHADAKEGSGPFLPVPSGNILEGVPKGVLGAATLATISAPILALMSLPVLVPLDMHAKKMEGDIIKINENIKNRAFVDRTVFPAESHSGFVYFEVGDRDSAKNIAEVLIKAKAILSDKELNFVFQIND